MKCFIEDKHFNFHLMTEKEASEEMGGYEADPKRTPVVLIFRGSIQNEGAFNILDALAQMAPGFFASKPSISPAPAIADALLTAQLIFQSVYEGGMLIEDAQERIYQILADLDVPDGAP